MTLMKTLGGAAVAVAALALPIKAETWDMPTPYPDATFHTVNIAEFAKDVEEATGGDLAIKVHSAGSLFKHPEISKAVRSGQVPAGEFFLSLLANDNPVFGADSLPFLATSYDEAQALWAAQEEVITQLLDEQGLMPLYAVPWPPQGLYTTKEITSVDDLAGLKFRTYNATLEQFANLAGAAPTQVEVPDIPQAFSTGRVEAMITSPSTGVNSKAWDFLTHYTDIQAWIPKNIVVVNKRAFRRLDEDTQTAVLEAAEAAEARGWEMSKSEAEEMTQVLKDNGITVVEPSEELTTGLQEIGAQMLEAWKEEAGETGQQLLDAYEG
ncbi:C4-dicarboxylate-binding periplasmic protein precursor [Roseovarius sp. THAF27]|uniref:TRAP transporter substrate-binding protein n=1 Tax=unclassified Roseovarius TaxID=2614913 RepID=UPI0012686FBF|nr:TRAP transporter substrate-binding protein [Roseovarius sp. THAF27]QFT79954.1 C4-dicarboxylate-binding periplasmic protein precursor [Roseovarius sp. THAF27]